MKNKWVQIISVKEDFLLGLDAFGDIWSGKPWHGRNVDWIRMEKPQGFSDKEEVHPLPNPKTEVK